VQVANPILYWAGQLYLLSRALPVGDLSGEDRLWGQVGQFYMLLIVSVGDLSGEIRLWGKVRQFYKLFGVSLLGDLSGEDRLDSSTCSLEFQLETCQERTGCEDRKDSFTCSYEFQLETCQERTGCEDR
jgi:hypothetical protein